MPEFVDDVEIEPPEIFGCPRPRDKEGRLMGFNSSCMSEGGTLMFSRSALQVGRTDGRTEGWMDGWMDGHGWMGTCGKESQTERRWQYKMPKWSPWQLRLPACK